MALVIIGRKYGQLGNRLFLFARFIANANDLGYKVYNPAFEEYAEYFEGTSKNSFSKYVPGASAYRTNGSSVRLRAALSRLALKIIDMAAYMRLKRSPIHEYIWLDDDDRFDLTEDKFKTLIRSRKLIIIGGWEFHGQQIDRARGELRHYFSPVEPFRSRIQMRMESIRDVRDVLVGVHIRLGDYAEWNGGQFYYGMDAYKALMEHVTTLFQGRRVGFLVCSNEKIESSALGNLDIISGPGDLIEDMYSMSECDYIIGPPSTYSGWAAFIGHKPIYFIRDLERSFSLDDFKYMDV